VDATLGAVMELLAVSKDTIRARVIRYFHDVFGTPISAFKPSTNVRNAYSYSDRAWDQLADIFNKLSWMRQLDVLLSPREMPDLSTIEELTGAIWGKLRKVVSVTGLSTRLEARAIKTLAAPKRAARAKRKAGAKPKRKAAPKSKRRSATKSKRKAAKRAARKKPNG
jgi:hypothetical protein